MNTADLDLPPMESPVIRDRLNRLRVHAALTGLTVTPSIKPPSPTNLGGLMLVDTATLTIMAGREFSLTIDAAESVVGQLTNRKEPHDDN